MVLESIEVEFFENIISFKEDKSSVSSSKRTHKANSLKVPNGQETDIEPQRSKRTRKASSFSPDFLTFMLEDELQTYGDAMSSPYAPYWK